MVGSRGGGRGIRWAIIVALVGVQMLTAVTSSLGGVVLCIHIDGHVAVEQDHAPGSCTHAGGNDVAPADAHGSPCRDVAIAPVAEDALRQNVQLPTDGCQGAPPAMLSIDVSPRRHLVPFSSTCPPSDLRSRRTSVVLIV